MKLENLVGREVLCTQDYYGVTKGKEYTIIDFNGDYFSIIEDGGKEQKWSISYLDSKEYFELTLDEWQPKQGEMVLWESKRSGYLKGIFICVFEDYFIVQNIDTIRDNGVLKYAENIKPYEDEIKVGDWVKHNKQLFKVNVEESSSFLLECTKITNPQLIELLNNEL